MKRTLILDVPIKEFDAVDRLDGMRFYVDVNGEKRLIAKTAAELLKHLEAYIQDKLFW